MWCCNRVQKYCYRPGTVLYGISKYNNTLHDLGIEPETSRLETALAMTIPISLSTKSHKSISAHPSARYWSHVQFFAPVQSKASIASLHRFRYAISTLKSASKLSTIWALSMAGRTCCFAGVTSLTTPSMRVSTRNRVHKYILILCSRYLLSLRRYF